MTDVYVFQGYQLWYLNEKITESFFHAIALSVCFYLNNYCIRMDICSAAPRRLNTLPISVSHIHNRNKICYVSILNTRFWGNVVCVV